MASSEFDVVIVGAGPAAWSSATFLARANIKTLVIGDPAQSGLADAAEVWNYVGFPKGISGRELLEAMQEQATSQGATFILGEVTHAEKINDSQETKNKFLIRTAKREEFFAKQLLLAHGANFIKVNLPGEKELVGKGIHYCALCDGPLYKGKSVIVVGNSNLAVEEALELTAMGAKVEKIITHAITANISKEFTEALTKAQVALYQTKVLSFAQQNGQLAVECKAQDGGAVTHTADAVFIALGVASSPTFAQKLGLEMHGNFLKADENGKTNVPGVWVAGLARGGVNQVGKSVGEGASTAVAIIKLVTGLPQYLDHT